MNDLPLTGLGSLEGWGTVDHDARTPPRCGLLLSSSGPKVTSPSVEVLYGVTVSTVGGSRVTLPFHG